MNETKEALRRAFMQLYERTPFEKMQVKELCATAHVARTTFYSHYGNLRDVQDEIENALVDGIRQIAVGMSRENMREIDCAAFFKRVLRYVADNRDYNYALLVKQPSLSYMEKWKNAIKLHFASRFPAQTGYATYGVVAEVVAAGVLSAYVYWMKHPDDLDEDKVSEIAERALLALGPLIS